MTRDHQPGRYREYPVLLEHDHLVSVILDHDGTFVRVDVLMPARTNYRRLPMPTVEEEQRVREDEWRALQSDAWRA